MKYCVIYGTEGLLAILRRHRELLPDAYSLTERPCASEDRYAVLSTSTIREIILRASVAINY